jgi:diaminopimelate decarboxylase
MMKNLPFTQIELKRIVSEYPTPFYIYDEKSIRDNIKRLKRAFSWNPGFKEYFAVKATPNPFILQIFKNEGCGVDCASETELMLAQACGFSGNDIMFTSNATPAEEFIRARKMGAIINLDDITHIDFLKDCAGMPELICCRFNPGGTLKYKDKLNLNMGESKFGFTKEQLVDGFKYLMQLGVKRFGIHAQLGAHRTETEFLGGNARLLFELVLELYRKTGARIEFINLAGGIGIPHKPDETVADIEALGNYIKNAYDDVIVGGGLHPISLFTELGIFMTGPYGYFVSSVLHVKKTFKQFIGLDASTNSFMSPARYNDYHHITVIGKVESEYNNTYDITGALCENRDKFAVNRRLPSVEKGDLIVFHDAGAYAYSHSYNFNGKLRPAELLLCEDHRIRLIRRAETTEDYFATLDLSELD